MKKKVVLTRPFPDELVEKLRDHFDLVYLPSGITRERQEEFAAALADAEGVIGASAPPRLSVDAELLRQAPKLAAVATVSVGYDHCDVPALTARKILLTHTPSVLTDTTADLAFTLLAATARRVAELDRMVRTGNWLKGIDASHFGVDIHHKTIGIVGMGRIGAALGQRASGFHMPVVYSDVAPHEAVEKTLGARYHSLEELLRTADFVCLTLPLLPGTRGLINRDRLALMKKNAILINTSRGGVVDQAALIDALRQGTIRAAGLDVFEQEPLPLDSPLRQLDNVTLLPHIGSATWETRYAMMECAINNMIASLDGTLRENCVNRELQISAWKSEHQPDG
jgi:gluconate 2-dehydrogenase